MKRILVPTDFSDQAENALKVAVQLAQKHDAQIYVLNLLELPTYMVSSPSGTSRQVGEKLPEAMFFMRLAHQRFEKLLNQDYLKTVKVTEAVEFRDTFDGIIDGVKKYYIDLIVMGSHGSSRFQEIFIGSNTEKVVRHSTVPVLVVKGEIPDFKVQDFVYATNLSPSGTSAFTKAMTFAHTLEANFHPVYINTANKFSTTKEINTKINQFTKELPGTNPPLTVYNDHTVEKGILNFAKQLNAQLMGVATHGRKGLAHFLNGSISEDLVNHAKKPVVTFHL